MIIITGSSICPLLHDELVDTRADSSTTLFYLFSSPFFDIFTVFLIFHCFVVLSLRLFYLFVILSPDLSTYLPRYLSVLSMRSIISSSSSRTTNAGSNALMSHCFFNLAILSYICLNSLLNLV